MKKIVNMLLNFIDGDYKKMILVIIAGIVIYFISNSLLSTQRSTILDKNYKYSPGVAYQTSGLAGIIIAVVAVMFISVGIVNLTYESYNATCESIEDFRAETRNSVIEQMGGEENVRFIQETVNSVSDYMDDIPGYIQSQPDFIHSSTFP